MAATISTNYSQRMQNYQDKCLAKWPALKNAGIHAKTEEEWKKIYFKECTLENQWKSDCNRAFIASVPETVVNIVPHKIFMHIITNHSLQYLKKNTEDGAFSIIPHSCGDKAPKVVSCAANEIIISKDVFVESLANEYDIDCLKQTYVCFSHSLQGHPVGGKNMDMLDMEPDGGFLFPSQEMSCEASPFYHLTKTGSFYNYQREKVGNNLFQIQIAGSFSLKNKAEITKASLKDNLLACYHTDGKLRLYDILAPTDEQNALEEMTLRHIKDELNSPLSSLLNDGTFILAGYESGVVKTFELPNLTLRHVHPLSSKLTCLIADGKKWAAGTKNNEVFILNCAKGKLLNKLQCDGLPTAMAFDKHVDNILYVAKQKSDGQGICGVVDRYTFGSTETKSSWSCTIS